MDRVPENSQSVKKSPAWLSRLYSGLLRVLPVIGGLLALAVVIAWISGAFENRIPPGETDLQARRLEDQRTAVVTEVTKDYIEEAIGTLKAASRSVISSKILATILQIHVSAGDIVSEGDLLVELNTRELDARLNQARESLMAASAAAREAENDFNRLRQLYQSNAASRQEFEIAERKVNVALADERRSEQAVDEAQVLRSYSRILAPKAGRIVDRTAEPGDTAQPGKPILTLYDSQSLRLETPVLEHLAVKLQVGQKLQVRVDSIDREFTAVIDEIVPQADVASRSFLVKASLPQDENLYEGMYGRLQIPAGTRRHLCIPEDAIRRIGQLEFADVVHADGVLQRRLIRTGRRGEAGHVEVLSGVNAGDRVALRDATSVDGVSADDASMSSDPERRHD